MSQASDAATITYVFLTDTGDFLYTYAVFHICVFFAMPFCGCCLGTIYALVSIKAEVKVMGIIREKKNNKIKKFYEHHK